MFIKVALLATLAIWGSKPVVSALHPATLDTATFTHGPFEHQHLIIRTGNVTWYFDEAGHPFFGVPAGHEVEVSFTLVNDSQVPHGTTTDFKTRNTAANSVGLYLCFDPLFGRACIYVRSSPWYCNHLGPQFNNKMSSAIARGGSYCALFKKNNCFGDFLTVGSAMGNYMFSSRFDNKVSSFACYEGCSFP